MERELSSLLRPYKIIINSYVCDLFWLGLFPIWEVPQLYKNQRTVSTAKQLASLFWYLIAST